MGSLSLFEVGSNLTTSTMISVRGDEVILLGSNPIFTPRTATVRRLRREATEIPLFLFSSIIGGSVREISKKGNRLSSDFNTLVTRPLRDRMPVSQELSGDITICTSFPTSSVLFILATICPPASRNWQCFEYVEIVSHRLIQHDLRHSASRCGRVEGRLKIHASL